MAEKQLRSLGKTELLNIMRVQEEEIERLGAENKALSERLAQRALIMEDAGSIAEASLRIGGVMQAAQESANIYLESLRVMESEYMGKIERKESEASRRAAEILNEAERRAAEVLSEAERRAAEILSEAERRAAAREALEKQTAEELWKDFRSRVDQLVKAHTELDGMIRGNPAFMPQPIPEAGEGGEA